MNKQYKPGQALAHVVTNSRSLHFKCISTALDSVSMNGQNTNKDNKDTVFIQSISS